MLLGLGSLVEREYEQIGGIAGKNGQVLTAGQPVGNGLNKEAAADFGLVEGTPVGSAVIDACVGDAIEGGLLLIVGMWCMQVRWVDRYNCCSVARRPVHGPEADAGGLGEAPSSRGGDEHMPHCAEQGGHLGQWASGLLR